MDKWNVAASLAAQQHGLLHVRQGVAAGIPRSTLYDQARRRGWDLVQPRVLALPGMPRTWERDAAAGVLSLAPRALLSRRAAGHMWGLIVKAPRPIDIVVPADRRVIVPHGCAVWRSANLRRSDESVSQSIPTTTIARTICDLAAVETELDELIELIATAAQRRLTSLNAIRVSSEQMGRFRGSGRLRAALEALEKRPSDSIAERMCYQHLAAAGIPPDQTLYPLLDDSGRTVAVLDMAYLRERVDVEVNGYAFHATPRQQMRDDDRTNAVLELGWVVIEISAHAILHHPEKAVAQVRRVLIRRRHELELEDPSR